MQFLSPKAHGVLDYIAALTLIIAPFVIGLQQIALWLSVGAGIGLIVYSLLTDYAVSIAKAVPYKLHLFFDGAAALTFIAAPFVLGFTGAAMTYYLVMGVGVLAVVAVSSTSTQVVDEPIGASA